MNSSRHPSSHDLRGIRAGEDLKEFYEGKEFAYHDAGAGIGERERRVLELFPSRAALRVFDVGCGSGRFLRVLKNLGHDPMGMDLSELAIASAGQSGVAAYRGSVDSEADLARAGKDFDVITALDVLEHTFDPSKILQQLATLVRPEGCLIASVPNIGCLPGRLTVMAGKFPATTSGIFDSGHIRFFTRSNLADYIGRSEVWQLEACTRNTAAILEALGIVETGKTPPVYVRTIGPVVARFVWLSTGVQTQFEEALNFGMSPLVSIVIPCYNGARYLPQAIESCLNQNYRQLELLVVDDASPDNCAEIAARYAAGDARVRVIRRPENGGVAAAFNTGFAAATGQLFSRLAQDDCFRNDAIEIMVAQFRANPEAGLVYCDEQLVDESGKCTQRVHKLPPDEALTQGNKIGLCVMWRRAVWEKIGGFDSNYDTVEDYEYWLRLRRHFPICHCAEAPLYMRIHSNMGSRVFSVKQELLTAHLKAKYASSRRLRRKYLAEGHFNAGYTAGRQGQRRIALALLWKSICFWPFDPKPYKSILRFAIAGSEPSRDPANRHPEQDRKG